MMIMAIKEKKYVIWAGTDLDFDHKNRYNNFKKINRRFGKRK